MTFRSGFLGILMLETRFPRLPGDIGHADSFEGRVVRRVVPGTDARSIVTSADRFSKTDLAARFIAAARDLEREGALAITTSCGFLVLLQSVLEAAVGVPVVTSSLLRLPRLLASEPQVGVLTIDAVALGDAHLFAAGVPAARLSDVVVQGIALGTHFREVILGDRETMDIAQAQADVVEAALALKRRAPQLGHVVLECTNLPPQADAIRRRTGFELHSLFDFFPSDARSVTVQEPPRPPIAP